MIWDESEGESFAEALENHRVTAATLTPSALAVLNPSNLPALATIAVAAETCPPSLVNLWTSSSKRMLNAYGPSENTVVTTWAELNHSNETFILRSFDSLDTLTSAPVRQEQVPIGTPLAGVQCYVFEATAVKSLQDGPLESDHLEKSFRLAI